MHEDFPSSSVALHLWNCDVTPKEAIEWTLELAKAAEWLNVTGVAHRFIRPENVLLSGEGNVLLAGFDAAVSFYKLANDREGEKFILQEPGLPREIPFELWDHLPAECFDKPYDPQFVDSWSIGVLLCTMLTGSHPFEVDMAKLSTQAASLPQQWRQSTERANVPYEGKDDDALRSLLDDIFQPAEQRMITFDMIRDIRLLRVISPSKARIGPGVYYRIDNHPHNPPQSAGGSTIVQAVNSYNTSLLSTDCRAMFEQKKWHVNIKSEEALRQRTNGTSYELLRNASFGSSFAVFREPFLAAASLDEAGNRKGFFLAKIFLISRLSPKYGSILRVESSKIMHYLGAHNTIPTLLRAVDIFFAPSKSAFKVIIFYANELLNSKSLHQLTMEKVFEGAQRKDTFDSIMLQLAETVQALAYHGVSHRYLRPEFIFYTSSRIIKVTNLEMMCFALNPIEGKSIPRSKGLHDDQEQNWTHLPPECFFERYDCLLLDVWSYGVVLVFCLTKRIPFKVPHTIIEATKVWSKFNQGNASTLAPFSDLLKKIFQSTENRIKGSELVQWYNLQRMKKKKASDKSSSIGGKPTSKK
ncbi:PREDICTED: ribosomal protein S6 kinase alpha-1-like [Rhagoletis zephyria]|uniref:ribosomal protein S6 kinase alpha-1-like n=1 Tax=Rhagoletis zephyria TaxID=28612 RepID=UPI00081133C9|nr:PREDICTED: ribosomal protein S6 kinase alpha-1-like [Rhagoletis zephyria]